MKFSSFKEIIDFAIKREEDAIKGYGSMINLAKTPGVKELLRELQQEEMSHKKLLQDLTEDEAGDYEPTRILDLKISDDLADESLDEDMDFQELLIFAAKKEQQAVELYSMLIKESQTEKMKNLFEFLVEQEKSHKLKLETEYEKHVLTEN